MSVLGAGLAVLGAGFALGAFVGFLFGIPRRLQEPARQPREEADDLPYAGNSSLEQISDWLTKIIVGVGLTQLVNAPAALGALGGVLGPALGGFAGSAIFGVFEFLYFTIGGFFTTYLWTRLPFLILLVLAEKEARLAANRDAELRALAATATTSEAAFSGGSEPSSHEAVGEAVRREEPSQLEVLWVDDRPSNNAREIAQLEARGIKVMTKTTSDEALEELRSHPRKYAAVISDLKRGGDREAGYRFMDRLRTDVSDANMPIIVYTASTNPSIDSEARQHGVFGATNSPIQLLELLGAAIRKPKANH
jgi:CheY-like chemotaxis protein